MITLDEIDAVKMSEICFGKPGVDVWSSTCTSLEHPPRCILDGNPKSFWASTGMFPQEIVISLSGNSLIKTLSLMSIGIKRLEVLKCDTYSGSTWSRLSLDEVDDADLQVQRLTPHFDDVNKASLIKLRILDAYQDVVSIFKVSILGSPREEKVSSSPAAKDYRGSLSQRLSNSSGSQAKDGYTGPQWKPS